MKLDESVIDKIVKEIVVTRDREKEKYIRNFLFSLNLVFRSNDSMQSVLVEKTFVNDENIYKKPGWGED